MFNSITKFFQIDEIRKRQQQQVLPKPNLDLEKENQAKQAESEAKKSSSASSLLVNPVKKSEKQTVPTKEPLLQGGEDPSVKDKRDTVKAVTNKEIWYLH